MAPLLKLREAARLIGVSPGRLYRAIADSWTYGRKAAISGKKRSRLIRTVLRA
jgi:predicted DNA-binding transcriptional regulator AlpA